MVKIKYKGRGRPPSDEFDFNEATFLRIQKDIVAGRIKPTGGRMFVNDSDTVGLRALIGKREISYHVQFGVRDKKTGETSARTTMVVGSYPDDSIQIARGRAKEARTLADEGEDPREKLRPMMFGYLDGLRETTEKKAKATRVLDKLSEAGVDLDALTALLEKQLHKHKT